jgi:hypothetical protein
MVPTSYGHVSCGTCGDVRDGTPRGRVPFHVFGWRFKKVVWNWTSLIIGVHAGRNPATGARFAYIGLGYGLGLDFYHRRTDV